MKNIQNNNLTSSFHQTIGIWGYGIVGKALIEYLRHHKSYSLIICDKRTPTKDESLFIDQHDIRWYTQDNLQIFFEQCNAIIPSPGIDLRQYQKYAHKFMSEIDIFAHAWHKPIIGITGTVGKTTVTYILDLLLKSANIPVATGGNIGIGMLTLISQQKPSSYALLELSSWQLEHNKTFAPHIAIWTNFSANHLDRHETLENYFNAKYQITAHQKEHDYTIAPIQLMENIYTRKPRSRCIFFSTEVPSQTIRETLQKNDYILYYHAQSLHLISLCDTQIIWQTHGLPDYSFASNWIAILAALYVLKLPFDLIHALDLSQCQQPHRLEKVATRNGVTFYNDSKSTTIASTICALEKCKNARIIHLFIGGLSKGADRTPLIKAIAQQQNVIVYCFGAEASMLNELCNQHGIQSLPFVTIEECLTKSLHNCHSGDTILFSPAGSSFDQFSNYQERGNAFKKAIETV